MTLYKCMEFNKKQIAKSLESNSSENAAITFVTTELVSSKLSIIDSLTYVHVESANGSVDIWRINVCLNAEGQPIVFSRKAIIA